METDILSQFLKFLIPLIIIMDPLGNLPFFVLFTEQNSVSERRKMAFIACAVSFFILIFFGLTGDFVLRFFGIGLPAFQIAGGFIFFVYSLQMLGLLPGGMKTSEKEEKEGISKENVALVPLATPLLAGPGAITAVMVRDPGGDELLGAVVLSAAILIACATVYVVFRFGERIMAAIGFGGIRVASRLMGLLLAVIAVQFMVNGFQQVFS